MKKINEHYSKKRIKSIAKYNLNDFDSNAIPKEIMLWKNIPDSLKKTLILKGPPGTGKTQYALAQSENKNPFILNNFEKFKDLDTQFNKALIYDDCDWSKFTREEIIHLIDNEVSRDIRILYNCVTIPPHLMKIITTNKENFSKFSELPEIKRRIQEVLIEKPLFNITNI